MKNLIKGLLTLLIALLLIYTPYIVTAVDTHRNWYATSLTGGGTGALDGVVSGASIGPYDSAFVVTTDGSYHIYKATFITAAENAPYVIRPDDVGGGVTSWELLQVKSGVSTTDQIIGGVSMYNLTTSQTLTREMMSGAFIGNYGATSAVTFTVLPAWKGATFNVSLDQDQTSGSTIFVVLDSSDKIINEPDYGGTSYYYLSGATGPSISLIGKEANIWKVHEDANNGTITQGTQ